MKMAWIIGKQYQATRIDKLCVAYIKISADEFLTHFLDNFKS